MTITYTEKGIGLHRAIAAAGHFLQQKDGTWISDNDVAVQAIIDGYNPLSDYKALAKLQIQGIALQKMQTLFPALADIDTVNLVAELWKSLAGAAKQPTANMTIVINIYTAALNGIASVNAAIDQAGIAAAVNAIVWPI